MANHGHNRGATMRVQIPAYADHWMRGDRYGEVVKVVRKRQTLTHDKYEVAHVLLDKSRKTVRVILTDCTEV